MTASTISSGTLDRTACRLIASYGSEAALVAYTKAVVCEASARAIEARRWRAVLARVVTIAGALESELQRGQHLSRLH